MKNGSQSQKNNARQLLGRAGEDRAAAFLALQGFICLVRNWRCRAGEIDLIVQRGAEIRFVEVKTRKTTQYGSPEEAVTAVKLRHLRTAAERWIEENSRISAKNFQCDVVTLLYLEGGEEQISWIQDV